MIVQEPIVSKDFTAAVDMTRLQVEYKYSLVAYVVLRTAYIVKLLLICQCKDRFREPFKVMEFSIEIYLI